MIDFHLRLLSDTLRVQAFCRAIHEVVRPGEVVLDIGTGTGILACFACQAGASRVYAVEREDVIQTAKEIAIANGYGGQIIFIQGDATSIVVPEPVDVIVGEQIGIIGIDEGHLQTYEAVSRKCLKPTGRLIPESIDVLFTPWEAEQFYKELNFPGNEHYGLNLQHLRSLAMNQHYSTNLDPAGRLSAPQTIWRFAPPARRLDSLTAQASYKIERGGVIHGFAGWFVASLSPGVKLSTSPSDPSTHWRQAFFPLENPIEVQPADKVSLTVTVNVKDTIMGWGWKGEVVRGQRAIASFSAHTFFGQIPPVLPLSVMKKGFLPPRSEKGEVFLEILKAMDGKTSLEALAGRLHHQFPHSFKDVVEARQHILLAVQALGTIGRIEPELQGLLSVEL
jgi:protein arginine N-methyltransferase 1